MNDRDLAALQAFIAAIDSSSSGRRASLVMPVGVYSFEGLRDRLAYLRSRGVEVVQVKGDVL